MVVIGMDPSFRGCGISDGKQHFIVATLPSDSDETQAVGIMRRVHEIRLALVNFIEREHSGEDIVLYLEAPAFGQQSQASHLYELGWLMQALYTLDDYLATTTIVKVAEVSTSVVRKWATGNGKMPKDNMKLAVYKKFGIEFEEDRGCDKLFAYLMQRFGEGVEAGTISFEPSAKRGAKRRKKTAA